MKPPRFTVRDLCWLVVVAAVACAWLVDQQGIRRREQELDMLRMRRLETQRSLDAERARLDVALKYWEEKLSKETDP